MSELGRNYIGGITTATDSNDVVNKDYVDNLFPSSSLSITNFNDSAKYVKTSGTSISFESPSGYNEYDTPGNYTFNIPSQATQFFIEVTGAGGGGTAGNVSVGNSSGYGGGGGATASWKFDRSSITGSTMSVNIGTGGLGGRYIEPVTWSLRTSPATTFNTTYFALYARDNYIISIDLNRVYASTNAINWVLRTLPNPDSLSFKFAYNEITTGQRFIGAASNITGNLGLISSTNGIEWTLRTLGKSSTIVNVVTSAASVFQNNFIVAGNTQFLTTSTDAIAWVLRTSGNGVNDNIRAIAFSNKESSLNYVYGGDNGVLASSTDSIVWTLRTNPYTANIQSIVFGNGTYVGAGQTGVVITSSNSVFWSLRTSGTVDTIQSLEYAGSAYVGVGGNGTVVTSTNGVEWTLRTSNTNLTLNSVTFGPDAVLFAGVNGALGISTAYSFATAGAASTVSFAGQYSTYTLSANGGGAASLSVGGTFGTGGSAPAATQNYYLAGVGGTGGISDSPPIGSLVGGFRPGGGGGGSGFSTRTSFPQSGISSIAIYGSSLQNTFFSSLTGNDGFSASGLSYGLGGNGGASQSYPFQMWSLRTSSYTNLGYYVGVGTDLYLAAGFFYYSYEPSYMSVSTDTIVWVLRTVSTTRLLRGVGFGTSPSPTYFAAGENGVIISSTNTIEWTLRTSPVGLSTVRTVKYLNNNYIVGTDIGQIATSTDSIVWTLRTTGSTVLISSVGFGTVYFYGSGSNTTNARYAISTDTIVWAMRTVGVITAIRGASYSADISSSNYIISAEVASGNPIIATSTDTIRWTLRTMGYGDSPLATIGGCISIPQTSDHSSIHAVVIQGSTTAGIAATTNISTSTNGIQWRNQFLPPGGLGAPSIRANNIDYLNNRLVVAGLSTDGTIPNDTLRGNIYVADVTSVGNGGTGFRGGGGGGGSLNKNTRSVGAGGSGGNGFVRISWT